MVLVAAAAVVVVVVVMASMTMTTATTMDWLLSSSFRMRRRILVSPIFGRAVDSLSECMAAAPRRRVLCP